MGLTRKLDVERLEPLGRTQQHWRSVPTPALIKRDLSSHTLYVHLTTLVKRPGPRRG